MKHVDTDKISGLGMTQPLAYAEIKFDKTRSLVTILATPDGAEIGYLLEAG